MRPALTVIPLSLAFGLPAGFLGVLAGVVRSNGWVGLGLAVCLSGAVAWAMGRESGGGNLLRGVAVALSVAATTMSFAWAATDLYQ